MQERLKARARIVQTIREFFIREGFLEVETPIFTPYAGQEPHLNPMKVVGLPRRGGAPPLRGAGYLITSPEYAHKKLLAAGFEKTFEITRAFRAGEPRGGLHNPEFTILEWYRAGVDYTAIMGDVEKMAAYIIKALKHENIKIIEYHGKSIDFSSPWERLTVAEAFEKYANTDIDSVHDDAEFFKIFLTHIEPKLGQEKPTILYEYPARMAALARLKPSPPPQSSPIKGEEAIGDPPPLRGGVGGGWLEERQWAERFEVYIAGVELANAFSELTDATEQRQRFLEEQKLRKKLGKEIIPLDEDFLDAVGHLPPAAGIALGVDRLVMLLTNAKSIEEVLAFPAGKLWP